VLGWSAPGAKFVASISVVNFTDPSPYQAAIHAARFEFFPTGRGGFRAELTTINLRRLWMQRSCESLARIGHGAVSPHWAAIGFLTDSDQPEITHCGTKVSSGEIIVNDQNEMHRQTTAAVRWGTLSMTPEDLADAGEVVTGRPVVRVPVTSVIRPSARHMSRLLSVHETVGRLAKATPSLLANPGVAQALEDALTRAMILCLTENTPVERSLGSKRHSVVMARLEEFLTEHETVPLYTAEVCLALGVSERTLRACCQENLGIGPIKYLWLRRMHLARRALVRATPDTSTVTKIAANHGFWEFGRFSVEYRALFGELPSKTLHQPPHKLVPRLPIYKAGR
jgi:AraC-like DNA-binding protein